MIKVDCPKCQRILQVPDAMAGKKGKCPTCKTLLTVPGVSLPANPPKAGSNGSTPSIPAPTAKDLEAMAAAALADEPPPVDAELKFIEFDCPMCGEKLKLDAELAGKRASCPECRRVIKVPELAKQAKKDWRKLNDGLPLGAHRPDQPVPEGAWGSVSAATVNKSALEEAGILKAARAPLTVGDKVWRGAMVAGAVLLLGVGYWIVASRFASSREQRLYKAGLEFADSQDTGSEIGPEGRAELKALAGDYNLHAHRPEATREAKAQLDQAITILRAQTAESFWGRHEREAVLADIAVLQVDLGGSQDEVDKGTHISWDDAHKGYRAALEAIRVPEARLEAFRVVAMRLQKKGQPKRVLSLGAQVFQGPEAELGQTLAKALDAANSDNLVEARNTADPMKPDLRFIALVGLIGTGKGENTDLDAALNLAGEELKGQPVVAWSMPVLAVAAKRAGKSDEQMKPVVDEVHDPVLRNRIPLALLKAHLADPKTGVVDEKQLDAIDAKSLERLIGRALLTRHNVSLDEGWQKHLEGWDKGAKAFGSIGAALGLQKE